MLLVLAIFFEKNNIEAATSLLKAIDIELLFHKINSLIDYNSKEEKSIVEYGNYEKSQKIIREIITENTIKYLEVKLIESTFFYLRLRCKWSFIHLS